MDIEEISGPKVPDVIHRPVKKDEPEPVREKAPLSPLKNRASQYEDLDRWSTEDKVTISPEARRKYRAMQAARRNNSQGN